MMSKLITTALLALTLVGCASTEQYQAYTAAHQAYAEAEAEKYRALAAMARQSDPTAKAIAAVMLGGGAGGTAPRAQIAMPESTGDKFLKWTSVLMPAVTQMYVANQSAGVAINQSNNAASTAISTNNAFVGIASKIQAPGAVTTTTYSNSYNQDYTHAPTVVQVPAPEVVVVPTPTAP